MKPETILKKAIEKAVKNGWKYQSWGDEPKVDFDGFTNWLIATSRFYTVIFSHSFAKAFWGDTYKIHLQQMVLSEKPINYLAYFLKNRDEGCYACMEDCICHGHSCKRKLSTVRV